MLGGATLSAPAPSGDVCRVSKQGTLSVLGNDWNLTRGRGFQDWKQLTELALEDSAPLIPYWVDKGLLMLAGRFSTSATVVCPGNRVLV